ncbi:MAG: type II secretion system major pseudopilin GspG [Sedimentisphaerales bacterium]|nr:type II secretion system major pseudopilin GspG [Planctomycetota bacterium]MDY0356273.1 type II secretion system major pseudopilin GspG [Sedimentisphaerales bacterium]NLT77846.1 type II secretion system major pseudopilin GspG [Planctomycetota bacterium]
MKESKKRQVRTGFTMVELMAVLIILGLLAGVVVKNFVGQTERAKVTTTKASLRQLASAVNQFYMDTNRYPAEDEGLYALIEPPSDVQNFQPGGYLDTTDVPTDGWGNEFIYELYPESGKPFVIKSLGADSQDGGEGYNADLLSTDR